MPHKVLSVATSKGGAGKTTLCITLASAFAHAGGRVALIDTDPQQSLMSWAATAPLPEGIDAYTALEDDRLMDLVDETEQSHHITIIDVQGTANTLAHTAIGLSNLVVIPLKASNFDARAAFETIRAVKTVGRSRREQIDFLAVLTCLSAAIASRTAHSVREGFNEAGIEVATALSEREAFRIISAYGGSLFDLKDSQAPGLAKAQAEASAFAQLVGTRLGITAAEAA